MAIVGTYMIVCEGASECNYLDHLNRFLATLPAPPNAMIPLRFIAVPRTIDRTTGTKIGCGGGAFNKVSKAYRSEWSNNKAYPFGIWVDSDLYVRNDNSNLDLYNSRPNSIPAFNFSVYNFEDFLALHARDDVFNKWKEVMIPTIAWGRGMV